MSLTCSLYVDRKAQTMTPLTGISSSRVARTNCSRSGRATGRGYSRTRLSGRIQERILCSGLGKSPSSQQAAVAPPAGPPLGIGVIAAVRQPVVHAQLEAH